jgi:hypothetical protein
MTNLLGLLFSQTKETIDLCHRFKEILITNHDSNLWHLNGAENSIEKLNGLFLKAVNYDTKDFIRAKNMH